MNDDYQVMFLTQEETRALEAYRSLNICGKSHALEWLEHFAPLYTFSAECGIKITAKMPRNERKC